MNEESFLMYGSLAETVFKISDAALRAEVAEAIMYYGAYGELPKGLSSMADIIMTPIKPVIDSSKSRYNGSKKGGQNAHKSAARVNSGSDSKVLAESNKNTCEVNSGSDSKVLAESDCEKVEPPKEKDKGLKTSDKGLRTRDKETDLREGERLGTREGECVGTQPARKRAFHAPTVEEVRAYCAERHNAVDPERFVDYYESNGWHVGKNPMKDWQAAVRTWERGDNGGQSYRPTARSGTPAQSQLDVAAQMIEKFHQEENEHEP